MDEFKTIELACSYALEYADQLGAEDITPQGRDAAIRYGAERAAKAVVNGTADDEWRAYVGWRR